MATITAKLMTRKEAWTLDSIKKYIAEHGYSPTLESLAILDGVSKITIFERVASLEAKGWITRDKHKARSIRVLAMCPRCGRGGGLDLSGMFNEMERLKEENRQLLELTKGGL